MLATNPPLVSLTHTALLRPDVRSFTASPAASQATRNIVPSGFLLINVAEIVGASRTATPLVPAPVTVARTKPSWLFWVVVPTVVFGFGFAVTRFLVVRRVVGRGFGDGAALGIVSDGGTVGAVRGGAVFDVVCATAEGDATMRAAPTNVASSRVAGTRTT